MKNVTVLSLSILLAFTTAYSQSLRFDDNASYVNITADSMLHLKRFTLEAWIKHEGTGILVGSGSGGVKGEPIITKGRGEDDYPSSINVNYFVGLDSNGRICADFEEKSGRNHPITSKGVVQDNVWTHVAVSYEPVTAIWRMYINGTLDNTMDVGSNIEPAYISIQPAAIGSSLNSVGKPEGYFRGRIDEVRIWNVAQTATAIYNNYKLELSSGVGLVARYNLNEGSGLKVVNAAGKWANGTLENKPTWSTGFNNTPPAAPVNLTSGTLRLTADSSAKLCATINDKNNDRLRTRFYGRKKIGNAKFTFVILPDTQYYTAETHGGSNKMFKSQTDWIARNRINRNIVYVGQLGDCTDHGDLYEVEWKRADTAIRTIESASATGLAQGIPYGICVGNHDQSPMFDAAGKTTFYNKYFGSARFQNRTYYGGHSASNNDNHYQLFSASGIDFLVICFEYDQSTGFSAQGGALEWGEKLIKQYPNRKVIVLTHWVINEDSSFGPQGKALYARYKAYPNVLLFAGGHVHTQTGEGKRSDTYNGHTIHSVLQDYQGRPNGGNGSLRIYEFDPQLNNLSVKTYSPYTNTYETDSSSQFNLKVALTPNKNPYTLLGEVENLSPGANACATWRSLEANTAYEWYATVFDGERTTTGPVWTFTTASPTSSSVALNIVSNATQMVFAEPLADTKLFSVFPNPNRTSHLNLSFSAGLQAPVYFDVHDEKGSLVMQKTFGTVPETLSISHHLVPGTYTVAITTSKGEKQTRKLIVTR